MGILHLSGLIAAMSEETTACCLALAKAAKEYGTLVSFLADHALEAADLGGEVLPTRLRAGEAQAELEVLLVAHQDVSTWPTAALASGRPACGTIGPGRQAGR